MIDPDELLRLQAAATPGPWKADNWSRVWYEPKQGVRRTVADCIRVTVKSPKRHRANARLIAAMHEATPELIDEIKTLRKALVVMSVHLAGACTGKCGAFLFCKTCDLSDGRNCADNVLAWHVDKLKGEPK